MSWLKFFSGCALVCVLAVSSSLSLAAKVPFGEPSHARCALPDPTSVMLEEGPANAKKSRLLQYWDLPNSSIWWSQARPLASAYRDFRSGAARLPGTNSVTLLERSPTHNNLLVARSAKSWIAPASCLEKLLFGLQHARINTFVEPTEFVSFVLRSPDEKTLRVYYYTVNQNGIGNMTPLTDPVRRDWRAGWRVLMVLHSHPFYPADAKLNGILAPSGPDADFNINFGRSAELPEARITNGLETVHIPGSAFDLFWTEDR